MSLKARLTKLEAAAWAQAVAETGRLSDDELRAGFVADYGADALVWLDETVDALSEAEGAILDDERNWARLPLHPAVMRFLDACHVWLEERIC